MLFVCGDTHADIDWGKLNSKNFPSGKELTKQDYILICGDFGGVWDGAKHDRYIQNWYNDKPWTTLFVCGNHENHDLLNSYPVSIWNGGRVHFITPSIIHLIRGESYVIDGHKIFVMGGAISEDRAFRIEGKSWWAGERMSNDDFNNAYDTIEKCGGKFEYVFSHCAPDSVQDMINPYYTHDICTNFLECVKGDIDFNTWFVGHYHTDKEFRDGEHKYRALYNDVVRLW